LVRVAWLLVAGLKGDSLKNGRVRYNQYMSLVLLRSKLTRRSNWVAVLVAIHGLILIAETLRVQFGGGLSLRRLPDVGVLIDISLLLGFTLLYLSLLLRRRKRNAWVFALALYVFLLGLSTDAILSELRGGDLHTHFLTQLLPVVILGVLWTTRKEFIVRSDMRTFALSLRATLLVLGTAFLYGTAGFFLMDRHDFRQEISVPAAMHYTVDQFALTTAPLHPYTRRARLFQESLSFVSISALGFVLVSLFQPLKARLAQHQKERYEQAKSLIYTYPNVSLDYFKLWPHDKTYFFSRDQHAGMAYRVNNGVALVMGDPFGRPQSIPRALKEFEELCFVNDWQPAFIQATSRWQRLYSQHGYRMQLIGREAIVDLKHTTALFKTERSFYKITTRFARYGYTTERCLPPHSPALIGRLQEISDEWLQLPARTERGFTLGYFSEAYLQRCPLFIARDDAGTIQAFLNMLETPVPEEASYDMLRSSNRAPGNTNDYLLMAYAEALLHDGYQRLSFGLCPLYGLEAEPSTTINRMLRFVYANGDRFYSFRGLYRFKAKYQPQWSDRYEVYRGGINDFARLLRALAKAMRV
jgi:phosphatidylglycerol lysyltransferase